jgi:hypothetical protein
VPQIVVLADKSAEGTDTVQLREWVAPALLENRHYSAQLIERLRWAAEDAAELERRGRLASLRPGAAE